MTLKLLSRFIGGSQLSTMRQLSTGEDGEFFETKMKELGAQITQMPGTYEQDGLGDEAIVHLHYFHPNGMDWYITERDGLDDEQYQAFGLAVLEFAELGYIPINEIIANGGELDLHWTPKTLREVKDTLPDGL